MQSTDTIGFEAAAALDAYEEEFGALRKLRPEPVRIGTLQKELRRVCDCCMPLPRLSTACIAFPLAHHRLLAEMARDEELHFDVASPRVGAVEQSLRMLQRQCRELLLSRHLR